MLHISQKNQTIEKKANWFHLNKRNIVRFDVGCVVREGQFPQRGIFGAEWNFLLFKDQLEGSRCQKQKNLSFSEENSTYF